MKPVLSVVELARLKRAAAAASLTHAAQGRPKVLFVDDEERILRAMQALFRPLYEVSVTTSGHQALEWLRQQHFHVLVSDQRMPEIQGIEVLRQAKEISPKTVRLLLTGYSDLSAIIASINDGEVFRYLNKPWMNEELQATLAKAVDAGLALAAAGASGAASPSSTAVPIELPSALQPLSLKSPASLLEGTRVLFIEHTLEAYQVFIAEGYTDVRTLSATSPDDALELMHDHEVSVVVVAVDGVNAHNVEFLHLLKREHPHVVSIVISDMADSNAVVSLINTARVFRVLFRPVKPGVLHMYINSAQKQAAHFRAAPAALKTEQVAELSLSGSHHVTETDTVTPPVPTETGSRLGQRLMSIKSFFRRH